MILLWSRQRLGSPVHTSQSRPKLGAARQEWPSRQRLGTYYQRFFGRPYLPVSSWRSNFAAFRFMPGSEPEEEWALL